MVTADELDRLREIRLRALADAPGAFGGRYEDEAPRAAATWLSWVTKGGSFVVEDEQGWHGLVAVFLDPVDASVCELISMWVDPSHRGQGWARQLLAAGIVWARGQQAGSVRLGVVEGNAEARRLYERVGFVPTGVTEPLRSDPAKLILFLSLPLGI
ncbi:MAG TPA: GNAT family N-acetyltransferase [Acidimicrobiales bacterium]|jgi:GNAT superfamily N-acetyltransferase